MYLGSLPINSLFATARVIFSNSPPCLDHLKRLPVALIKPHILTWSAPICFSTVFFSLMSLLPIPWRSHSPLAKWSTFEYPVASAWTAPPTLFSQQADLSFIIVPSRLQLHYHFFRKGFSDLPQVNSP